MIEEIATTQRPQCGATIATASSRDFRESLPLRCERQARYKIDGICYCGQHAGTVAIKMLLKMAGGT